MTGRTGVRIGLAALGLAALVSAWALFAPPQLGGSTRYVILDGRSMEPALAAGDLALVRTAADAVGRGDVVLYDHPGLRAHVLHRIVRESNGRFVLKGDDNDFLDDVRPTRDEVKGELWFAVPGAGSAIVWLREPLHAALLVFLLAFVALGGLAALTATRRRDSAPRGAGAGMGAAQPILAVALGAVIVLGGLGAVAFSRAPERTVEIPEAYAHVGTFSYGAEVEPSDVYPHGVVRTGEAAFLELVPALDVAFEYRLAARDLRARSGGTVGVTAVLTDGLGWQRELPLGEPVAFVGSRGEALGTLDLGEVSRVVEEMKALTGSGTSTFGLTLAADVVLRGAVGDTPIRQSFAPKLRLALDPVSLRPETSAGEAPSPVVRRAEPLDVTVPAAISLGSLRLSVDTARRLALLGLAVALLVAGLAGLAARRDRRAGPTSRVAALLGDRLVTLSRPPSPDDRPVTELGDLPSLVQIAEHYDRIVLHWYDGHGHVYQVDDGSGTYRLRLASGLERGRPVTSDDEDTLVLAPATLPSRAAAG